MKVGTVIRTLIDEGKISDPDQPRGRLLAAAAKLFREKGYAETTVRELAAEVGILSGSIFHHFNNKGEILFAVMKEVVVSMEVALEMALSEAETTEQKIRTLIAVELGFIHGKTSNATAVLVSEWRSLTKEQQTYLLKERKAYFDLWHEVLEQAQQQGLTRIEAIYLRQLLNGAIVWTAYWYKPGGELSMSRLVEKVLALAVQNPREPH
jgi:TetR/AcrR family transcriptional regulator, cholesterol catabolism regulator